MLEEEQEIEQEQDLCFNCYDGFDCKYRGQVKILKCDKFKPL